MNYPSTLRIGAHDIKIVFRELGDGVYGEFSEQDNIISIDSRLPESQKEATLLHEIIGVCNPTMHENEVGHMLMESLSQQLYQVLVDNKLHFGE